MIDDTKPILPQLTKIEDEEGIDAVQQVIYDMTPEQIKRLQSETDCLLDRISNKIVASIWN